ncbi:MAG: tRNA pseudouridine(55) synthase TruB [Candidatus Harrisonbacteria bacterium CG10_big_fil_rev_8_21_14_0_10_45_28]|uniref:tRNA pseudouridine synthase B n=1 Tax=Candidatus Harrisonbacteria bacterium CG10_big_fil_rev_8_21_14_0_10_45_28 TaxID=1974586 RepID=A0A2H0UP49_9BACT|nr:MAG: tRNA pseudouridine(55) synthase TruB [Candidatus Harrisonbacteria bacterium CG10_big_fil_rev_8_21_14_0_10_45_28]
MEEIILVDKLRGITSFDVIRILRRKLGIRKMGHAGTLDPLASGLMLIGVEKGTKKLHELLGLDKTYVAEVLLGKRTSTGDLEGDVIEEKPVPDLDEKKIEEVLEGMVGTLELAVSIYSAIKKDGRPLYKYARAGQDVGAPVRAMTILSAKLLKIEGDVLTVELEVKSGVYIRSVGEELGRCLGTVATLANLRRTKIGPYKIEDAIKLDD